MKAAAASYSYTPTTQPAVAFGTLVDLARLRLGISSVEICDACNTINIGSPRYCKGCWHKLPAFYVDTGGPGLRDVPPLTWHASEMARVLDEALESAQVEIERFVRRGLHDSRSHSSSAAGPKNS